MGEEREEEDLGNVQLNSVLGGESMWVLLRKVGCGSGEHLELTAALAVVSIFVGLCSFFFFWFCLLWNLGFLGLRGWSG